MRRRDFIVAVGGTVAVWPGAAIAQSVAGRPLVAMLIPVSEEFGRRSVAAFQGRLSELGYVEGRQLDFAVRYAPVDAADRVSEIVALAPAVIVTSGVLAVLNRLHQLPSPPPVVWAILSQDPVALGFAQSFAHPGGNMTGAMAFSTPAIVGKQLGILKELVPSITRLDALLAPTDAATAGTLPEASRNLGMAIRTYTIARAEDLAPAIAAADGDALFFGVGPLFNAERRNIVALVAQKRRPAIYTARDQAEAGGLISYGADVVKNYRLAGDYVAKILAGAKPADLPIEQPNNYELVINVKTANSLGLTIPPTLLARADEVVE